jgi:hypothetical protein
MPKLYRTNPSIPRPESRYGSRSTIYDKVIQMKRSHSDPSGIFNVIFFKMIIIQSINYQKDLALQVYQPEDVHLIRDILNLEYEPLNQVLKVESLRPDLSDNQSEKRSDDINKISVNKNITPMGRPVNVHRLVRWKPPETRIFKNLNEDIQEVDELSKKSDLG